MAGEVALVGEPGLPRGPRDRPSAGQERSRAAQAGLRLVGVRRQPDLGTKDPRQVERAEVRLARELLERDRLADLVSFVLARMANWSLDATRGTNDAVLCV